MKALEKIELLKKKHPCLRIGQIILNAVKEKDLFNISDEDLDIALTELDSALDKTYEDALKQLDATISEAVRAVLRKTKNVS